MNLRKPNDLHQNHDNLLRQLFEEVRNCSSIVYEGNFDLINPQEEMDEARKINSISQSTKRDTKLIKT